MERRGGNRDEHPHTSEWRRSRRTAAHVLNRIAEEAHFYTDREIAERLKGYLSGTGLPLTPALVTRIRREHRIAGLAGSPPAGRMAYVQTSHRNVEDHEERFNELETQGHPGGSAMQ